MWHGIGASVELDIEWREGEKGGGRGDKPKAIDSPAQKPSKLKPVQVEWWREIGEDGGRGGAGEGERRAERRDTPDAAAPPVSKLKPEATRTERKLGADAGGEGEGEGGEEGMKIGGRCEQLAEWAEETARRAKVCG